MGVARERRLILAGLVAAAACAALGAGALAYERERRESWAYAASLTGGDPSLGRELLWGHGCGSCHVIPGAPGADGGVGPSLGMIAKRSYIGGVADNTPQNMVRWLKDPRSMSPRTAMPSVGLTDEHARAIAAYLYTLD